LKRRRSNIGHEPPPTEIIHHDFEELSAELANSRVIARRTVTAYAALKSFIVRYREIIRFHNQFAKFHVHLPLSKLASNWLSDILNAATFPFLSSPPASSMTTSLVPIHEVALE
jgi:hypothetical protein